MAPPPAPQSAASEEDEQTRELEQLEEQRLRERDSSQVGDEEENDEDREYFSEDDVFGVSKKARSKVNLSTEEEEPTRERLAELLENPYPHKHRKQKTSISDPVLTAQQTTTAYRQLDRSCRWLSFLYMASNFQSKQPYQMKTDPAHVHTRIALISLYNGLQMKCAVCNKLRRS